MKMGLPLRCEIFFNSVYLNMFRDDTAVLNAGIFVLRQHLIHYTPASFVSFLSLIEGSVKVDWTKTMGYLMGLIECGHTIMMGLKCSQELICQMYIHSVHSLGVVSSTFMETMHTPRCIFRGWKDVPPIVCMVLKIPRAQFMRFNRPG